MADLQTQSVEEDFDVVELQEGQTPPEETPSEESEGHEEDEAEDEEEESTPSETDDERAAIRERRRQERELKKKRRREFERRDRLVIGQQQMVIQELQQRLQAVERTTSVSQMAQLDNAITEAEQYATHNEQLVQQAIETGNGAIAAKAMKDWNAAQTRANELKQLKANYTRTSQQGPSPTAIDPVVRQNTESWAKKNSWFDMRGTDLDSRIALQIDDQLAKDGYDPKSSEYWEELDNRIAQYLPHRANKRQVRPRSPVQGSGKASASSVSGKKTVYLSPARVQAIKDSGAWDNPEARNRMIKAYQDFDRNNKS